MSITKEATAQIVGQFQRSAGDTGSVEVQVALLTHRINNLTTHLQSFKKDKHTRRGLLNLVSRRRHLLVYLKRTEPARYQQLIKTLDLRS
jgi:small subunit ribosomal protein S15